MNTYMLTYPLVYGIATVRICFSPAPSRLLVCQSRATAKIWSLDTEGGQAKRCGRKEVSDPSAVDVWDVMVSVLTTVDSKS